MLPSKGAKSQTTASHGEARRGSNNNPFTDAFNVVCANLGANKSAAQKKKITGSHVDGRLKLEAVQVVLHQAFDELTSAVEKVRELEQTAREGESVAGTTSEGPSKSTTTSGKELEEAMTKLRKENAMLRLEKANLLAKLEVQGSQVSGAMKTTNRLTGDQLAGRHKVEGKPSAVTLVNNNEVLAKDQQELTGDERKKLEAARTTLHEAFDKLASAIKEISAATAREKGAQLASNNKIKELEEQLRALQKKYDDLFRPKPKPLKPVVDYYDEEERKEFEKALRFVRTFVPHDIFNTSIHKIKQQGLNETQVDRLWSNRALWLVRMAPEAIAKIHIGDLRNAYNVKNLGSMELQAVYAALPSTFEGEENWDKTKWKREVKEHLQFAYKVGFDCYGCGMALKGPFDPDATPVPRAATNDADLNNDGENYHAEYASIRASWQARA